MAKCPECGNPKGHNAYCSQNPRYPTPSPGKGPVPNKQHPVKRPDDGRKRPR